MQRLILLTILLLSPIYNTFAQKYLGQTPPGLQPKVFAQGLISLPGESDFGSVFSKNGKEFFYATEPGGKAEIRYMHQQYGQWTKPRTIVSHPQYGCNDPFLSPDEKRLYFISEQPKKGKKTKRNYDIWYVQRTGKGWSAPINAGPNINSDKNEYYISFTQSGTMYFSSNKKGSAKGSFDIYAAKQRNGQFMKPKRLGDAVNTPYYEADVFVAPDESYLIFCAQRPGGKGRGDLYVSFKQKDGSWTKSKNIEAINTASHELCPFVTADGKYLFYTSKQDIYWVDAKVIEQYRK
ncbi:MAG TPA: hypothetical protein DCS93_23860 [Microscillaceae bacterium]|nr:hypothetical protein [Microscillaceae bacterium]